jgi:hypothetical protein
VSVTNSVLISLTIVSNPLSPLPLVSLFSLTGLVYRSSGVDSGSATAIPSGTLGSYDILVVEYWAEVDRDAGTKIFYFGDSVSLSPSAQCFWNLSASSPASRSLCCSVSSSTEYDEMCSPLSFSVSSVAHVSVEFNPVDAEMKLFVNGSLSISSRLKSGVPGRGSSASLYFTSGVKEFRVWAGRLSEEELASHFLNGPDMNLCECATSSL